MDAYIYNLIFHIPNMNHRCLLQIYLVDISQVPLHPRHCTASPTAWARPRARHQESSQIHMDFHRFYVIDKSQIMIDNVYLHIYIYNYTYIYIILLDGFEECSATFPASILENQLVQRAGSLTVRRYAPHYLIYSTVLYIYILQQYINYICTIEILQI